MLIAQYLKSECLLWWQFHVSRFEQTCLTNRCRAISNFEATRASVQANCNECRYYHDTATFTSIKTVLRSPGLQFTFSLRAKASENTFATVLLKGHFLSVDVLDFASNLTPLLGFWFR